MSDDKYRVPDAPHRETTVPLVDTPGQLYPPVQDPQHPRHHSDTEHKRHSATHSHQGIPPPSPRSAGETAADTAIPVVISQPTWAAPGATARYRMDPLLIVCQSCNATVTTTVLDTRGLMQYLFCVILCLMGCWFGCCLIPLFINDMKDVKHTCPNCGQFVGKFVHMG